MRNDKNNLTGVRACTGCGRCDYCKNRGVTAADVLKRSAVARENEQRNAVEYQCPNCNRWAIWTDGEMATVTEGPTFWCQTCSAETPLAAMESRYQ